jgi:hypothetical protein
MPRPPCHACGKTIWEAYQCDKCGKVLCANCKGPYQQCSQSKNGTKNCSGTMQSKG